MATDLIFNVKGLTLTPQTYTHTQSHERRCRGGGAKLEATKQEPDREIQTQVHAVGAADSRFAALERSTPCSI